jgi:hypothetical protein
MPGVALKGITGAAPQDAFAVLPWFEPFGIDGDQLERVIARLVQAPYAYRPIGLARHGLRPLPPGAPQGMVLEGYLLDLRVALVVRPVDGQMHLVGACPVLGFGTDVEARVERVLLAPNGLQALVEVTVGGYLDVTYLDPHFAAHRGHYHAGAHHGLRLVALALSVDTADPPPLQVPAGAAGLEALARHLVSDTPGGPAGPRGAEPPGATVTLHFGQMKLFLPRPDVAPHCVTIRGPVVERREWPPGGVLGQRFWYLRLVCAEDMGDGRPDILLDVAVPQALLGDGEPPEIGSFVAAVALVQGQVVRPDTPGAAADATGTEK